MGIVTTEMSANAAGNRDPICEGGDRSEQGTDWLIQRPNYLKSNTEYASKRALQFRYG